MKHTLEFGADVRARRFDLIQPWEIFTPIELPGGQLRKLQERGLGVIDPALAQECVDTVIEAFLRLAAMLVANLAQPAGEKHIQCSMIRAHRVERAIDRRTQDLRQPCAAGYGQQRVLKYAGRRFRLALELEERALLQQPQQVARLDGEHPLERLHFIVGQAELAKRRREVEPERGVLVVLLDRAFEKRARSRSITGMQLVDADLIENQWVLGRHGLRLGEKPPCLFTTARKARLLGRAYYSADFSFVHRSHL